MDTLTAVLLVLAWLCGLAAVAPPPVGPPGGSLRFATFAVSVVALAFALGRLV